MSPFLQSQDLFLKKIAVFKSFFHRPANPLFLLNLQINNIEDIVYQNSSNYYFSPLNTVF